MKSRIKKLFIIASVGLFGVAGATAALARHGATGPEHRLKFIEQMVSAKLDLNDAQKEKLSAVRQALLEAKQRNQADRERQHQRLENILLDDTLDRGALTQMLTAHQQRMNSELPDVLTAVETLHASLSQEQKQRAVDALKALKARHKH